MQLLANGPSLAADPKATPANNYYDNNPWRLGDKILRHQDLGNERLFRNTNNEETKKSRIHAMLF